MSLSNINDAFGQESTLQQSQTEKAAGEKRWSETRAKEIGRTHESLQRFQREVVGTEHGQHARDAMVGFLEQWTADVPPESELPRDILSQRTFDRLLDDVIVPHFLTPFHRDVFTAGIDGVPQGPMRSAIWKLAVAAANNVERELAETLPRAMQALANTGVTFDLAAFERQMRKEHFRIARTSSVAALQLMIERIIHVASQGDFAAPQTLDGRRMQLLDHGFATDFLSSLTTEERKAFDAFEEKASQYVQRKSNVEALQRQRRERDQFLGDTEERYRARDAWWKSVNGYDAMENVVREKEFAAIYRDIRRLSSTATVTLRDDDGSVLAGPDAAMAAPGLTIQIELRNAPQAIAQKTRSALLTLPSARVQTLGTGWRVSGANPTEILRLLRGVYGIRG